MANKDVWAITNCRVSSEKQLENKSLDRQSQAVVAAAAKIGAIIPRDGQWSGSVSSKKGSNYDRKDVKEMLDYCKKHKKVKYLIIDEPDRFMRSINEAFYWETVFEKEVGVKVWYASDDSLNTDDIPAKLLRFTKYLGAENSNDERQHKSIAGGEAAIRAGRYPYPPKLGYMRGSGQAGVYILAPEIGELMRSILKRLAAGLLTLEESLVEFNESSYVKGGKHCSYKMDKWRLIVKDPYYAGIVEMNKQVKARNENGLHEAIITKEEHLRLVDIEAGKKKNQSGAKKGGNPEFPLNKITFCETCHKEEVESGRVGRSNRSKFVGENLTNGKSAKVYSKYTCRKCRRRVEREDLHGKVKSLLDSIDFTKEGEKALIEALRAVWRDEEAERANTITRLQKTIADINTDKSALVERLSKTTNQTVADEIERSIVKKVGAMELAEKQIADLKESSESDKAEFLEFALGFANNLGDNFFSLTPEEVQKCELLIFPSGFMVNAENKVHTPFLSPLYRYGKAKLDALTSNSTQMVRVKRL